MTKLTTLIALLALAMLVIVPASAVWHNGNWLTEEEYSELTDGTNVIYNPQSGVSSKYKAVDNGQNDYQYSCDLRGSIRAHVPTLTPEVLLSNDLAPNDTMKLPVLPDGSFEFTGLAYGNYTLTLLGDAGNGGQTETAKVVCGAPGGVVYPQRELMGHAVSGSDSPVRGNPLDVTIVTDFACGDINIDDIREYGHWMHFWFFNVYVIDYVEVIIEVDRVHADVTNPNGAPVNVDYNLDFNYYVDATPHGAQSPTIVPASETYYGHFYNLPVGTTRYSLTLYPSIENAVGAVIMDWDIETYDVTVTNIDVTSTTWTS